MDDCTAAYADLRGRPAAHAEGQVETDVPRFESDRSACCSDVHGRPWNGRLLWLRPSGGAERTLPRSCDAPVGEIRHTSRLLRRNRIACDMDSTITFDRPAGQGVQGSLARAEQPRDRVVVIQEWRGLNDQMRGVADLQVGAAFADLLKLCSGSSTMEADAAHRLLGNLNYSEVAAAHLPQAPTFAFFDRQVSIS